MKKFWAIPVKDSISDYEDFGIEEFVVTWARRYGAKYERGSFLDDCWAMILMPKKKDAEDYLGFVGEFGLRKHFNKPSNKCWVKVRGSVNDYWYRGTGKRILA